MSITRLPKRKAVQALYATRLNSIQGTSPYARLTTTTTTTTRYEETMDDSTELNEVFASAAPDGLPQDVLGELQSILRVHSISAQELFFKWESYCLKMGPEETRLDLGTVRLFKRDIQESLERDSRGRAGRQTEKKSAVTATPRTGMTTDVFGM